MQAWYRLFAFNVCPDIHVTAAGLLTFGEKSSVAVVQVPAQEPAVTKIIVALYEFYAVSLGQTQLISTACYEVVHDQQYRAGGRIDLASQNRGHGRFGVGWCLWCARRRCQERQSSQAHYLLLHARRSSNGVPCGRNNKVFGEARQIAGDVGMWMWISDAVDTLAGAVRARVVGGSGSEGYLVGYAAVTQAHGRGWRWQLWD